MNRQDQLKEFATFSNRIGERIDYVQGGGGNTSLKIDDETMLIKASGYYLSQVKDNDGFAILNYPVIANFFWSAGPQDLEAIEETGVLAVKKAKITWPGFADLRPSVESGFHSILGRYVAHTHSVYANILLCCDLAEELIREIFAEEAYIYVPYVNPGSRLTFEIASLIRDFQTVHDDKTPDIVFMQNHGMIVHAETADQCFELHERVNRRICRHFGIDSADFPMPKLREVADREFCSATPYLIDTLKKGKFTTEFLLEKPLYPDQIVYLRDILGQTAIIGDDGVITYHLPYKQAILLEQALTAILFIMNQIEAQGLTVQFMHESQQNFIKNWESEKYRKELASKEK